MQPRSQPRRAKAKKKKTARATPKPMVFASSETSMPIEVHGALPPAPPSPPVGSCASPAPEPDDRLILRLEAARVVGVSVATLRRYERSVLKPALVDEHNVHWHSLRACERFATELGRSALAGNPDRIDGAKTAAAFELFDSGSDAVDVIKALKIEAAEARVLQKEWADLRGAMLISGETLAKIRQLRTSDDNPIFTGEELLLFLEGNASLSCPGCWRNPRQPLFCMTCYVNRPPKAEALAAQARQRKAERDARFEQERLERELFEQARERVVYDPVAAATARAAAAARSAARQAAREQRAAAGQSTQRPLRQSAPAASDVAEGQTSSRQEATSSPTTAGSENEGPSGA